MNYFGSYENFKLSPNESPGSLLGADNAVGDIYDIELDLADGSYTGWLVNQFGQRIGYFSESFSHKLALLAAEGMALKAVLSFIAYSNIEQDSSNEPSSNIEQGGGSAPSGSSTSLGSSTAQRGISTPSSNVEPSSSNPSNSNLEADEPINGTRAKAKVDYQSYGRYWGSAAVICFNKNNSTEFDRFIHGIASRIADDVRPKIDLGEEAAKTIMEKDGNWVPKQSVSLPDSQKGMTYIKRRRRAMERLVDQGRSKNKGCYLMSWALIVVVVAGLAFTVKSCMGV